MGIWTFKHDAVVQKVLQGLTDHAGLRLPDSSTPFMLEAYYMPGGYGGVLYQQEHAGEASFKPKLVPVGCVSTTKLWKLNSDVEHTLAAMLYCLQKFQDWIATLP